jgi:hypothetical protein
MPSAADWVSFCCLYFMFSWLFPVHTQYWNSYHLRPSWFPTTLGFPSSHFCHFWWA